MSALARVIDDRHLALPLIPGVFVTDKIRHKASDVDSAGHTRVENCASGWRRMHHELGHLGLIDEAVGTYLGHRWD